MNPPRPTPGSENSGADADGDGAGVTEAGPPPDHVADDRLLALLCSALAVSDPVPDLVLEAAIGAHAWRNIDQELAELVFDSAHELTGVRDRNSSRQLTFRSATTEVEVMVMDGAERRLVGQLVPARATTVAMEDAGTCIEQSSDEHGRFSFDHLPSGPVRLAIAARGAATPVTTDWIML